MAQRENLDVLVPIGHAQQPMPPDLHGRVCRHAQRYDHRAVGTPWQRRYVTRFEAS